MKKEAKKESDYKKWNISEIVLILANLIPLFGVLFLGWDLFSILIIYWLESAIIGFYTLLKMAMCWGLLDDEKDKLKDLSLRPNARLIIANLLGKMLFVPSFIIPFGALMFICLMFIFLMNSIDSGALVIQEISSIAITLIVAVSCLFISHGVSFYLNFIKKQEYKKTTAQELTISPYGRIFVMYLTILFGGFLVLLTQMPAALIALFIILKIFIDLSAHRKEHEALILKSSAHIIKTKQNKNKRSKNKFKR